jgi:hypothetical protein
MSADLRRAALLTLCVVVLLVAASILPATGFGTVPTPVEGFDGGGPGSARSTEGVGWWQLTPSDPSADIDGPTATATSTPTTTTPPPVSDDSDGGGDFEVDARGLVNALGWSFLLGLAGLVVLRALGYERRGWWFEHPRLPDLPPARIRAGLQLLPASVMAFVVGLSAILPRLFDRLLTAASETADATGVVFAEIARAAGLLFVALPRAFASALAALGAGFAGALGGLSGAFSSIGDGLATRDRPGLDRSSGRHGDESAGAETADGDRGPLSVEGAWRAMTRLVRVRNPRSATPSEYARAAIDRGLPAAPVRRLTRLFEEVRYGGRAGSETRTEAARAAFAAIRRAVGEEDES